MKMIKNSMLEFLKLCRMRIRVGYSGIPMRRRSDFFKKTNRKIN
jgi:hypothetical protein